ncbi:hypothetical protein HU200_045342 [Digitaria exilis]|uniref:Alkaline ceramidase n=1 Tax=Digitaria exilis TaxID=1010633 RepID=A0A835AXY5_9POAL|nr:hypothetical protein HU200_045342 [Digitaria exilis]
MADSMVASFWGPVTSTTELCEENYAHSSYIAEFFNTISNVPCILLALIGLVNAFRQGFEKRFSVLHISNMILAIGSMIFHATLQLVLQQSDETPMVWEILLYIRSFLCPVPSSIQVALHWPLPPLRPSDVQVLHTDQRRGCEAACEAGHAWWHVLMGLNSYYANTFLMFCRAQQRGWEPRITHLLGFLPYVKVQKPEKRE